ncbi:MAG TPA: cytochrome c oxidase assembly protein [Bryobacteraceae bacterium]|nr:cytochrome c oxidase assembly protein [Bryobacteraceae bacterium]
MNLLLIAFGVATLWIAVASPVAHLDHHLLTAHMVQHLLLMVSAAPLILLGARSIILQHGLRQPPVLVGRLGIISRHPALCWLAGTLTVIVWHVPAVFELALRSHFWHEFERASFFLAGILFWWPVILPASGTVERWSVPLYLFLATLPCDALAAFLAFCGHVVYRPYLSGGGHFRLSPLEDQTLAGALMWVAVTFAYLIPALVVTAKLLSDEREYAAEARVFLPLTERTTGPKALSEEAREAVFRQIRIVGK